MKLLEARADRRVFELNRGEWKALEAALQLGLRFRRAPARLTRTPGGTSVSEEAQADLEAALASHWRETSGALAALLHDPERCRPEEDGYHLTLSAGDAEALLQGLNQVRVGAWEAMGRPDFETEGRPKPNEKNLIFFWALQVADEFQSALLHSFVVEDFSDPGGPSAD